ncbi:MAG: hypothetical protein WAM28_04675 [Chlamydiales bacterium]
MRAQNNVNRFRAPQEKRVKERNEAIQEVFQNTITNPDDEANLNRYEVKHANRSNPISRAKWEKKRHFILGAHNFIVECRNRIRKSDFISHGQSSLQLQEAAVLNTRTESTARMRGICTGSVLSFFKEVHNRKNVRMATPKFENTMPVEAYLFHKISKVYLDEETMDKVNKGVDLINSMLISGEGLARLRREFGEGYVDVYERIKLLWDGSLMEEKAAVNAVREKLPTNELKFAFSMVYEFLTDTNTVQKPSDLKTGH